MTQFVKKITSARPLTIPPKGSRYKGIQIYCTTCRRWITNDIKSCTHPENQQYKVLLHVPGTKNKLKSKVLPTRDYKEAVIMTMEYEKELIENNYVEPVVDQIVSNRLLSDNMLIYLDYLNKAGLYARKSRRIRSESYRNCVKNIFEVIWNSLEQQGYSKDNFLIDDFNDKHINRFLDVVEKNNYSPFYYNKFISYPRTFFEFLDTTANLKLRNPFNGYQLMETYCDPKSATKPVFMDLLKLIKPENGFIQYKKERKNLYRPWLIDAFKIAIQSGRRREELVNMKFSDIEVDKKNIPNIIYCIDLKDEHQTGRKKPPIPVPITPEFRELLIELGYEQYKNTTRYLFGHDEKMNRSSMVGFLTKSFTHFYRQLKTDEKITFKALRKTFATAADNFTNGNGKALTGQSSNNVLDNNYRDKKACARKAAKKGFSVFENV